MMDEELNYAQGISVRSLGITILGSYMETHFELDFDHPDSNKNKGLNTSVIWSGTKGERPWHEGRYREAKLWRTSRGFCSLHGPLWLQEPFGTRHRAIWKGCKECGTRALSQGPGDSSGSSHPA